MRRLLTGSVALGLLVLAGSLSSADDKPADAKKPAAGTFAALKAEYDEVNAAFSKEMSAKSAELRKEQMALQKAVKDAETDEDKKAATDKLKAFRPMLDTSGNPGPKFAPKFLAFAEKNPADPAAFDSLSLAVRTAGGKGETFAGAIKLVKDRYVAKPEIKPMLRLLASVNDDSRAVVREVIKGNPDRKVQFSAIKSLVSVSERPNSPVKDGDELKKLLEEKYSDLVIDLSIGKKAPEVELNDITGKPAKLSALKGRVVVLDIWATWCGPCVAMIPHEKEMTERLKDKAFTLVSISADEKLKTLTDFIEKKPMPWTHWWAGNQGGFTEDWDVQYFPTIYVIDAKGVIRHKDLRGEKLEEAVNELIKEQEKDKGSN